MRPIAWLAAIAVALGGCSGMSPADQSLAGVPGLHPVVQRYYEARATEENGRCRSPLMEGVLSAEATRESPDRLVVGVRYLYRDHTAELRGACRGFAQRTFTIEDGAEGPMVVAMSGGQHPRGLRLRLAS